MIFSKVIFSMFHLPWLMFLSLASSFSQIPSQPIITNLLLSFLISYSMKSGTAIRTYSSADLSLYPLKLRSPMALVKESLKLTLPWIITPPEAWTLFASLSRAGLWSSERGKATLSSRTQVLESPTFATIKWSPTKRHMFAVHPASGLFSLRPARSSAPKSASQSTSSLFCFISSQWDS